MYYVEQEEDLLDAYLATVLQPRVARPQRQATVAVAEKPDWLDEPEDFLDGNSLAAMLPTLSPRSQKRVLAERCVQLKSPASYPPLHPQYRSPPLAWFCVAHCPFYCPQS